MSQRPLPLVLIADVHPPAVTDLAIDDRYLSVIPVVLLGIQEQDHPRMEHGIMSSGFDKVAYAHLRTLAYAESIGEKTNLDTFADLLGQDLHEFITPAIVTDYVVLHQNGLTCPAEIVVHGIHLVPTLGEREDVIAVRV